MTAIVLRGDARQLPLPDASVDLIVTSPPYFGLRSYTDGGVHYGGQIGSEGTPQEWVAALVECTREWARVLKPSGSMFVNLGDKYAGGGESRNGLGASSLNGHGGDGTQRDRERGRSSKPVLGAQPKSLLGLPWRYAIAATDQLGLILRRDIIWAKPNGLPESVTDRCRSSHEYVFHLTRQPRYYAAVDEIREPQLHDLKRVGTANPRGDKWLGIAAETGAENRWNAVQRTLHPLGKLPGSVWNIPSQPLTAPPGLGVDHFAAFPSELPRRCVLGWSPGGVCVACGEGRRPVRGVLSGATEKRRVLTAPQMARWCSGFADWCAHSGVTTAALNAATGTSDMGSWWASRLPHRAAVPTPGQWDLIRQAWPHIPESFDECVYSLTDVATSSRTRRPVGGDVVNFQFREQHTPRQAITGYACACPTPDAATRPAIVLDPFGGTGTTALVASVYGRTGISIDHSADYCRLAAWRTQDPAERCRVIGAPKPPPVLDGQDALFDLAGETT